MLSYLIGYREAHPVRAIIFFTWAGTSIFTNFFPVGEFCHQESRAVDALVLREANDLAPGTPIENLVAMYETARSLSPYA